MWVAAAVVLVVLLWFQVRRHVPSRHPAAESVIAGFVVAATFVSADSTLAVAVAVPTAAGWWSHRRSLAARAEGMAVTQAELVRVAGKAAAFAEGAPAPAYLPVVDRFVGVFDERTARASRWAAAAEALLSPVTILTVVVAAGWVFEVAWRDLWACAVCAPVVVHCVLPPGTRPVGPVLAATAAEILQCLRQREVRAMAGVTMLASVGYGAALVLALSASDGQRVAVLVVMTAACGTLSIWAAGLAQRVGVGALRRFSHEIAGRPLPAADVFVRQATRDVVVAAGLAVHGIRPIIVAGVVPVTVLLAGWVPNWHAGSLLVLGSWCAVFAGQAMTAWRDLQPGIAAMRQLPGGWV